MKVSNGEKLILLMLSEIYKKLDLDGEIDPNFIQSAIYSDNLWGLEWKYSGIPFEKSETPRLVKEVVDTLDMWDFIEASYERLSNDDKQKVEEGAKPFGKDPKFRGFDGNNESEYMNVAGFLIDDLERFQRFEGRGALNSHSPTIDSYKRMFGVFEAMRKDSMGELLNAGQLISILLEKVHPENR